MGMSLKSKMFYAFVRKAMKKYIGNEGLYIEKRCPGQKFSSKYSRECNYKAPKGYIFERGKMQGVNYEFLKKKGYGKASSNDRKVVYMLHGGAYHMAMADLYNGVMEKYSCGEHDVFTIDYRTAPRNPFPAAVDDAIVGYRILLSMGYTPDRIIMAGDSAGGGLALAMAFRIKDMNKELGLELDIPKCYVLSSPWVDLSEEYTEEQKKDDVLFGWGNVLEMCAKAYANGYDLKSKYISPTYGDLSIFDNCRFYISVAKGEMLQQSGIRLASKLISHGAIMSFDELESGMHACITMYAIGTKEVKYAWKRINEFISNEVRRVN